MTRGHNGDLSLELEEGAYDWNQAYIYTDLSMADISRQCWYKFHFGGHILRQGQP